MVTNMTGMSQVILRTLDASTSLEGLPEHDLLCLVFAEGHRDHIGLKFDGDDTHLRWTWTPVF